MRHFMPKILTTIVLSLPAGFAFAQQAPTSPMAIAPVETSGMVGIVAGQTARLNALNPGVPAPLATGAQCPVQVSIVDDQGNVLKTAQLLVAPGKSMPVDFVMSTPGRLEIRAVITFTQPTPVANPSVGMTAIASPLVCPLIPTFEIFDTSTSNTLSVLTDFHFTWYGFLGGIMTPNPATGR